MNNDFESRVVGFEKVQRKIETNMSQMHNVYREMQTMLNQKYQAMKNSLTEESNQVKLER